MINGTAKIGAIVGIVGNGLKIFSSIFFYFFGVLMVEFILESEGLSTAEMGVFKTFILITTIFSIVFGIIALVFTINYLKNGKFKIGTGILNILSLSLITIIAGILILVSKDE